MLSHDMAVSVDTRPEIVPGLRGGGDHSLFGPEVPVPGNAAPTDRLMAFLGRARQP